MNNRLAEFASIQVEAVDGALEMVARDRRRVEALLEDAETPSLRQYCIAWLNSTPAPAEDIVAAERSCGEERAHDEETSNEVCCSRDCWKDFNLSFWDTFQSRPRCVNARSAHTILHHHQQRSRLAFGVSYEWVNEPNTAMERWSNGEWDWEDADHYFQGREVCGSDENLEAFYQSEEVAMGDIAGDFYRIGLIEESGTNKMERIFGDSDRSSASCLPTVNEVARAGGSILYDILFLGSDLSLVVGGEMHTLLRHHHTAKGTLNLTFEESYLKGTAELDPRMESFDAVPFGGNFSWIETSRRERIQSSRERQFDAWNHSSTSLLFLTCQVNNLESTGELKVIGQRTAAFLTGRQIDDHIDHDRTNAAALDLAAKKVDDYKLKGCLWMHRHTELPVEVIHRISTFVSPPPVLYLEKGDLVLDIDWGPTMKPLLAHDNRNEDEQPNIDSMSLSTIIARPRKTT